MSKPVRLASFCRLCLSKTKDKVPVFAEGNLLESLLRLIEIEIDENDEPDAVVCYDCVVTLEGFHQFKEQCHVNDEFVKTIPPKADNSGSSGGEEEEDDREESGAEDDEGMEEEDRLELSEAEEVFHALPSPPAKSAKSKRKAADVSPKKTPAKKPTTPVQAKRPKMEQPAKDKSPKTSLDELQVLQESYPDYFYFEKGSRSIYYTLIYYGERFNSAIFAERTTYWQCIHRRKYTCPAQVRVSNDYKSFERFYEHTHKQLREKEGQAFTPHEALPELFKICKRIVEQKKIKQYNMKQDVKEESFESQFQEFAEESMRNAANKTASPEVKKKKYSDIYSSDSEAESGSDTEVQSKKKPKPSSKNVQQKKQAAKEPKPVKPKEDDSKCDEDIDLDPDEEQELDLEQIEQECDALNVPKRPSGGPTLEEMLVLQDSYPDYFFFEKGPRSIYFTLVYYGERFHSALFTERYTYWQCRHRRKYRCPAQVCVTNDYKTLERRYEHSHPELPDKEGQAFTPMEALPELFEACRKIVHKNRAKRRQKLLHKYQFLNSINSSDDQPTNNDSMDINEDDLIEIVDDVGAQEGTPTKDFEYEELIEED
ncbi:uncharacterized protein LOC109422259 [Aedes albopictus]|uniref:ZAD domain-containing protein n=1 Tax=Aedes albopictus TaxID=7160 RepID=A0ABM1Y336_AEDAL